MDGSAWVDPCYLPERLGGTAKVDAVAWGRVLYGGATQAEAEQAALAEAGGGSTRTGPYDDDDIRI